LLNGSRFSSPWVGRRPMNTSVGMTNLFGPGHKKQICHPDRSAAQWRDLLFPRPAAAANQSATLPLVIPTGAYPNFCYAASDRSTCAAFIKESRMQSANATNLDRNSGGAQWRDLQCALTPNKGPASELANPGISFTTAACATSPGRLTLPPWAGTRSRPSRHNLILPAR
jgi:hypothetical protein